MTTTATHRLASEKQIAFFERLYAERDFDIPQIHLMHECAQIGTLTSSAASRGIDILLGLPKKLVVHEDGETLGEGYYWQEGLIYKVQTSGAGRLYAKVFSEHGYEYAPGAMRHLTTATRLTLGQAAEAGVKTGRCVICAKELTDPESVERGIGPVCMARI